MKRFLHILLLVSGIVSVPRLCAEDYYFRHINMADGLPQMSVSDVYQDEEGYMWFATRQGVARYDGRTMRVFNPDAQDADALLSPTVEQIAGDTLGNVYIRTTGINRYNLREGRMETLHRGRVEAMAGTTSGVYFAGNGGLYHYDAEGDSVRMLCELPSDMGHPCLVEYMHGIIYIGTVEGDLYTLSNSHSLTLLYQLGSQIACVYETSSHTIYVGTWADGMYAIKPSGIRHYTTRDGLVSDFVRAIHEDQHTNLWIGTDVGLQRFSDKRLFLEGRSVWRLRGDKGGNLWGGTYFDGVFFFNPSIDYYSTIPLPFESFPVISHILPLDGQRLVLSTEGNGLYVVDGKGKVLAHADIPNIKATYYDEENKMLYLGSHLHGLYTVSLSEMTGRRQVDDKCLSVNHYDVPFPERNGSQIIRSIVASGDSLLLGTHNGVYSFDPAGKRFRLLSSRLDSVISKAVSMCLSQDGRYLYVGGERLYRYDLTGGRVDSISGSVRNIERLLVDQYGRLWAGTDGDGVWSCVIDDEGVRLVSYSSRTCGLQNDYIRNLLLTPLGHIMVVTTRGYSIIQSHDSSAWQQYPITNYSPGTYLPLSSLYNGGVALSGSGEIILAGMDGMIRFREEHLHQIDVRPEIVLESPYQYCDKIILSPEQRDISLHYCIQTNNIFPENLSLQYSIACKYNSSVQHLNDWVGDIRLMNLHYGVNDLLFQVKDHRSGELLSERRLQIRVKPPFYLSWVAIVCYVLVFIACLGGGAWYLRRRFLLALQKQEKSQHSEVRKVIDTYIDNHLNDAELDVSQLCRQLGIGRTRLFQIFHDVYNTSPQQLIAERRLLRASDWLVNKPECNISEIAYDLGFQSPKYFSHCFKARFGVTPSAYRKSHS